MPFRGRNIWNNNSEKSSLQSVGIQGMEKPVPRVPLDPSVDAFGSAGPVRP
jgi:hypothetical protein